jgi:hypothetical protein
MGAPWTTVLPSYSGECIDSLSDLTGFGRRHAPRLVLLVIDGLGYNALQQRREIAPTLAGARCHRITSVVPTTTAAGLTSLTAFGLPCRDSGRDTELAGSTRNGKGLYVRSVWSFPAGIGRRRRGDSPVRARCTRRRPGSNWTVGSQGQNTR